jgi:hypothetical protein
MNTTESSTNIASNQELVHVRVSEIRPAPENDNVYGALSPDDPEIWELVESVQKYGIKDPLLVSTDNYIISGHRRRFAAMLAKLDHVPVLVQPVSRSENPDEFKRLLVHMNSQRIKSTPVLIREALMKIDPDDAYQQIIEAREEKDEDRWSSDLTSIDVDDLGQRCKISKAKLPVLNAIKKVLDDHRAYWPMSDRQIHYRLLGPDAPLKHASKPDSIYRNDKQSYRALVDLLARARIAGKIPWGQSRMKLDRWRRMRHSGQQRNSSGRSSEDSLAAIGATNSSPRLMISSSSPRS